MLTCKDVSRLVSESLDHKLPLWPRLQVRMHLLMCRLCSRFRQQMVFLKDAARHYWTAGEETDASPGLSPEARERLKQALRSSPP